MMEGMNSTMTYCKNFGKCHKVPPVKKIKKYSYEIKERKAGWGVRCG
jgi:hypothetical protein